jgi:two-component system, sensor histidine kinase and response regulator
MKPSTVCRDVPSILIVDDTPTNLQLLSKMLKECGYRVRPVLNGMLALQAAKSSRPDLILLDVRMPKMDGYEVCTRLKEDVLLRDIPIIFISALHDTRNKLNAFSIGGVDYVTKPFQFEEVRARVDAHLKLSRLQVALEEQRRDLQESYDRLQKLEALRDNLTHMLIHDMRSPLTAVMGYLSLLKAVHPDFGKEKEKYLEKAQFNVDRLIKMLTQLLDVSRLESGKMPLNKIDCDLTDVARETIDSLVSPADRCRVILAATEPVIAVCDRDILLRIISNLLVNALSVTPKDGVITIDIAFEDREAFVAVSDMGPGIQPEYHQKIFEKFGYMEMEKRKAGDGVGLAFCKLAIEAHEGRIGVESEVGKGSRFWLKLPARIAG